MIKFGDASDKWTMWYERLTKSKQGFSFDRSIPIIGYIDAAMKDKFGDPEDNPLWTWKNLRDIKERIISDIERKLKSL